MFGGLTVSTNAILNWELPSNPKTDVSIQLHSFTQKRQKLQANRFVRGLIGSRTMSKLG